MKKRNSTIELLRCILMFLIVLHHVCLFSGSGGDTISRAMSTSTAFATGAFIAISGYYGMRFSLSKVTSLLVMGVFASITVWLLGIWLLDVNRFQYSLGWFGNSYLAMLLLMPIVNAAVDGLSESGRQALITAYCAYALAMVLSWIPLDSVVTLHATGWDGHSFNTLLFVFVTMRVIRILDLDRRMSGRFWGGGGFVVSMMFHIAFTGYANVIAGETLRHYMNEMKDFNSPWLIAAATSSVIFIVRFEIPEWVGRVAAFLAPSMFPVFLIHAGTNSAVSVPLYRKLVQQMGWHGPLGCLMTAVIVFAACVALDMVRRVVLFGIEKARA